MPFLDYTGLTTFWNKVKDILAGKQNSLTAGEGVSIESDTVSVQEPIKEVTQAQYDALSDAQKNAGLYVVTDTTINLNDHGDIYSTEETRIGTWIDGKPLYRRVIKLTTPNASRSSVEVAKLGVDVDSVVNLSACVEDVGRQVVAASYYWDDISYVYLFYNKLNSSPADRSDTLRMAVSSSYENKPVNIIIEYTKTTDLAPTVLSVSTQSLPVNSLTSTPKAPEKVVTSQVPLPSYVTAAPASASSTHFNFAPASASASSVNFTFAPASASSTNFTFAPASEFSTKLKL